MKQYLFVLLLLIAASVSAYAQCQPDDQVESWYSWAKGYENTALDYFPVSEAEEMIIGDSVHNEMKKQFKLLKSYGKQEYLNGIVKKLSPYVKRNGISYAIHVIDDNRTLNAFSVAGGHVYITAKMVEWTESEDELAFIIAHELAHCDQKHGIRKVQKVVLGKSFLGDYGEMAAGIQMAVTAPFGQIDEYEADREGAIIVNKAGYNPRKGLRFFEKMSEKEMYDTYEKIIRTHPYSTERYKCLDSFIKDKFNK